MFDERVVADEYALLLARNRLRLKSKGINIHPNQLRQEDDARNNEHVSSLLTSFELQIPLFPCR